MLKCYPTPYTKPRFRPCIESTGRPTQFELSELWEVPGTTQLVEDVVVTLVGSLEHHPVSRMNERMKEWKKEGTVLFNDALNTFSSRLYGVRHMVKNNSDRERGNPLPPHRLVDRIYHNLCYTSCAVIAQWGIDPTTYHTTSRRSITNGLLHLRA